MSIALDYLQNLGRAIVGASSTIGAVRFTIQSAQAFPSGMALRVKGKAKGSETLIDVSLWLPADRFTRTEAWEIVCADLSSPSAELATAIRVVVNAALHQTARDLLLPSPRAN